MEVESTTFDNGTNSNTLLTYISKYSGYTKILRLQHIADKVPSQKLLAYKLLIKECKESFNTVLYTKICSSINSGESDFICDDGWVQQAEKKINSQLEILESDLSSAKSSMVKESIRIGHNDIGHLYYQIGNLNEALKSFLRTRDFCTLPRHNCEMCLNIVGLSIDLNQYFNANNFINKVTDTAGDVVLSSKVKAASGLVALHDGLFKAAALKFVEVDFELGNLFNSTLSDEDIGLYGTICALATFSRQELRRHFVERKAFLNNYTSLSLEVKALALGFIHGKYESCLKQLEALAPRLAMDIHLSRYASSLTTMIAEKILVQYFAPYNTVSMTKMATALGMSYVHLEASLAALIASGRIPARIDSQGQTLFRTSEDSRRRVVDKVVTLTQVHTSAVKRDMLRLSLLQQGLVVESASERGRHGQQQQRDDFGADQAASAQSSGSTEWMGNVFSFFSGSDAAVRGADRDEYQMQGDADLAQHMQQQEEEHFSGDVDYEGGYDDRESDEEEGGFR